MTHKQFPVGAFEYDFEPIDQPSKNVVFEAMFVTEPTPLLIADFYEREGYVKFDCRERGAGYKGAH